MRFSSVIRLAQQYFLLGMIGLVIGIALFLFGYFVVYRRLLKGTKKLKMSKVALLSILFIYIVIVFGATIGDRVSTDSKSLSMHLFSSYKDAWNNFSPGAWRNIILNILMFVPLGILLPLIFKNCRKYWVTYLVGLFFTLIIEVIQLISGRGIFEIDDIFNNTLGCIIGYGIVMIFISFFVDKNKYENNKKLTLTTLQLPLCLTVIGFSIIFISYSKQELGNLSCNYIYKQNMADVNVTTNIKLKNKPDKSSVYKATVGSAEDTLEVANEILSSVDSKVDDSKNDVYDNTIIYKSKDENYSVWVDYTGLKARYINFPKFSNLGKENLTYNEVKSLLSDFNIELPERADFKNDKNGNYSISVDMIGDDKYINGMLVCSISETEDVISFTNNIVSYKKYKDFDIISEKEAYEKLLDGKFITFSDMADAEINIKDIDMVYEIDSKGFYQPVYKFTTEIRNSENYIFIPALR